MRLDCLDIFVASKYVSKLGSIHDLANKDFLPTRKWRDIGHFNYRMKMSTTSISKKAILPESEYTKDGKKRKK